MTRSRNSLANLRSIACCVAIAIVASCGGSSGAERRAGRRESFVSISAGERHLCGVRRNGSASCFQVESANMPSPIELEPVVEPLPEVGAALAIPDAFSDVAAIAAGRDRSCAIRSDRTIACASHGAAGPSIAPSGVDDAIAIGMGSMHLAVVRPDNVVEVYDLRDGQLAFPTRRSAEGHLELAEEPRDADLGSRFGCASTRDGHVYCWGSNWGGECGNGGDGLESQPVAVVPPLASDSPEVAQAFEGCEPSCEGTIEGVVRVDVRSRTACALLDHEGVACWGESMAGSFLPNGSVPGFVRRPVMLAGTEEATDLCVGIAHVCVRTDDAVLCRGEQAFGSSRMTEVASLRGATSIACTASEVCGLFDDGSIRCEGGSGRLRLR